MGMSIFKKCLTLCLLLVSGLLFSQRAAAQMNDNHLMLSVGALYERGLDATLSYEHGTKYHNAWEFFGTYYIKYEIDELAGHYTKQSFWDSYRTWNLGIVYKPCVKRGRNHHGNVRIGASGGSNTHDFLGTFHLGYEHTYSFPKGWEVFFQVREDVVIPDRKDLFRTGISLGFKIPLRRN